MVLFGRATFLTGVIAAQSRNMPAKLKASPKLGGVKKKTKIKIVAVSFFLTPLIFGDGGKISKSVDFEQQ